MIDTEISCAAVHGLDVAGNLSELISELVLLYVDAAGVSPRDGDGRLEVGLAVNILHHLLGL